MTVDYSEQLRQLLQENEQRKFICGGAADCDRSTQHRQKCGAVDGKRGRGPSVWQLLRLLTHFSHLDRVVHESASVSH